MLDYVGRFDPQDHPGFALEERIFVATHVLPGEHVDVLSRSLIGTTLVDNRTPDHNRPTGILRIDDRHRDPGISTDVVRLEVTRDRIDKDV